MLVSKRNLVFQGCMFLCKAKRWELGWDEHWTTDSFLKSPMAVQTFQKTSILMMQGPPFSWGLQVWFGKVVFCGGGCVKIHSGLWWQYFFPFWAGKLVFFYTKRETKKNPGIFMCDFCNSLGSMYSGVIFLTQVLFLVGGWATRLKRYSSNWIISFHTKKIEVQNFPKQKLL